MSKKVYDKPPFTIEEMLQQFKQRGLIITDYNKAETILKFVSYYRFTGYGLIFEKFDNGKRLHQFKGGTTFNSILYRYDFDRHVKLLLNDAIERIEIGMRTIINHHLSLKCNNSHWYLDKSNFSADFPHKEFLSKIQFETGFKNEEKRKNSELFIKHYFERYDKPELPCCWMIAEVLPLGTWSKVYSHLRDRANRKAIAKEFDLSAKTLESWLHSITFLRNLCAHHSRVFNRSFTVRPKPNTKIPLSSNLNNRFGYFACILFYMLNKIAPEQHWHLKLKELIEKHHEINLKELGLPEHWSEDPFWTFYDEF